MHHPRFILRDDLGLCQLKEKDERVLQSLTQALEFLVSSKGNFISFSTSTNMDRESLKWGFRTQRCSFVRVSYITRLVCDKRKTFPIVSIKNRVNEKDNEFLTANENKKKR